MDRENQQPDSAPQGSSEDMEPESAVIEETSSDSEMSPESESATHQAPKLSVIGLGASAGGLTALRSFFAAMPDDTGMTFVVVVHLSPEHESVLAELLQGYSLMPVDQ